ncbi:hypothetical protein DVH24_042637 [Malus domestica]|uniref:Uncharacterized protein n=1 Tax=Malus domestica TaxID=3750 RepID=A0A498HYF2_MALDO|nr:hypothetical protein DVH24_042637 [Malus domestica]
MATTFKVLPSLVAAMKKCRAHMPQGGEDLYDESNKESSNKRKARINGGNGVSKETEIWEEGLESRELRKAFLIN